MAITDPNAEMLASAPERISASLKGLGATKAEAATVLGKIELCSSVASAVGKATVVFEAAPEKLDLKKKIFAEVESHAPADATLASNTSVIQITRIMQDLAKQASRRRYALVEPAAHDPAR